MKKHWRFPLALFAVVALGGFAAWIGREPSRVVLTQTQHSFAREYDSEHYYGASHDHARSSKWPAVREAWLKDHPKCAFKGCDRGPLEVHHVKPFHEHPELELDRTNFITLCRDEKVNHHLYVGHDGNFKNSNPNVREDARLGKFPKRGGYLQKLHEDYLKTHPK